MHFENKNNSNEKIQTPLKAEKGGIVCFVISGRNATKKIPQGVSYNGLPPKREYFSSWMCQVRGRVKPRFKTCSIGLKEKKPRLNQPPLPPLNNHNGCRSLVLSLIEPTKIKRRHDLKNDNYACVTYKSCAENQGKPGNKSVTVSFIKR